MLATMSPLAAGFDRPKFPDRPIGSARPREAAAAKAATPTLGELVPKYLKVRTAGDDHLKALRPASMRMVRLYLEVTWQSLHKRPINQITRADIKSVLDDVARQTGKSTADRASTALSTLLAWCVYSGLLEQNPVVGLKSYNGNARRKRVLSEAELAQVYQASYDAGEDGRILRLLILTGCRRKEIGLLAHAWRALCTHDLRRLSIRTGCGLGGRRRE